MTMASPAPDDPSSPAGASSELRRSVGQATERIHEIIDAAERVAVEIRSDAEAEAERYLDQRRREADRLAADRTAALDQLTKTLANSAERFKHQAEQMLADLDRVISEARAGVYRNGALAAVEAEPEPSPEVRLPEPEPELRSVEPDPEPAPEPELRPVEPPPSEPTRIVSAYAGEEEPPTADSASAADQTSEALLRATQMAVTGKDRAEIVETLRTDFPGVNAELIADEILA